MTTKQKKGIRTAVLTLLFVLLVIGMFFDSRHGNLAVQAESIETTSEDRSDLWSNIDPPPFDRTVLLQVAPEALIETDPVEKTVEIKKPDIKKVEIPETREIEKKVTVAKAVGEPEIGVLAPEPWDRSTDGEDDHQIVNKPVSWSKPGPGSRPIPDPDDGQAPEVGKDINSDGDRNRGHGNEEDGYDEDNPGRRGTGKVKASRERRGNKDSGKRRARGKHRGRGGSKRR